MATVANGSTSQSEGCSWCLSNRLDTDMLLCFKRQFQTKLEEVEKSPILYARACKPHGHQGRSRASISLQWALQRLPCRLPLHAYMLSASL
jgi:hypothetical protein